MDLVPDQRSDDPDLRHADRERPWPHHTRPQCRPAHRARCDRH
jgi:hypothetical protein